MVSPRIAPRPGSARVTGAAAHRLAVVLLLLLSSLVFVGVHAVRAPVATAAVSGTAYTGWGYVTPAAASLTAPAWQWTGAAWTTSSRMASTSIYIHPFAEGWVWTWRSETGWLAMRAADASISLADAPVAAGWKGYAATATPSWYVPVDGWTASTAFETGRVDEVVRVGATTYLAGNFTKMRSSDGASTVGRSYVGAVDAVSGALRTTFAPVVNGRVTALEASPDGQTIYIGGDFTTVNGVARDGLAALDATTGGLRTTLLADMRVAGAVYDLAATSTSLYVAGTVTSIGGAARTNLARLDLAGGALTVSAWRPAIAGGRINAIEVDAPRSRVVIGGAFTSIGGQAAHRFIGAVSIADGSPLAWADHPPAGGTNRIIDLDVTSSGVYAAQGGSNWARAYELATGRERWSFNSDGDNQAIAEYGGRVVVGFHGNVTAPRPGVTYQSVASAERVKRDKIFMLDASTGALQAWNPSLTSVQDAATGQWSSPLGVWSLDAAGGSLYVGGDFGKVAGRTQSRFAILPRS